ncbi:hypothetical protein FUAX_29070 [Fulvitalea axinellae]|uniref:DUF1573 domain-containing protein n=1 Tax=Fulvitalea axinellae TaxID=1182444 RepID=A0AAU9CMA9_9BACT|nr:hypothetical protein FUAX_29070 [Fulvitalea axinellae]
MKTLIANALGIVALATVTACSGTKSENTSQTTTEAAHSTKPATELTEAKKPNAKEAPKFQFEQTEYKFGEVKQGAVVTHVFKFKNTGKSALVIQNIGTSCGCTTPSYSKEPIAPGKSGEITVKFDTKGKRGQQSKSIRITANTIPATTVLRLLGAVDPGPDLSNGPVKQ